MQQLSGRDAIFLYLETPDMPMHAGALQVFELPAGFKGRFVTVLREHVTQRLAQAPVLRRRLWWMPLNMANPAWVDAEPDLRQHIVEHRLPPSARLGDGHRELQEALARLHMQLLDRSRPLWRFHVLEGLAPAAGGRRRVGLYTQLHHAAVDGQAAVALANVLLDVDSEGCRASTGETRRARRSRVAFEPGMTEMLRSALGHQAQQVAGIIRDLPSTIGTLRTAAGQAAEVAFDQVRTSLLQSLGLPATTAPAGGFGDLGLAPRTRLNVSVGSSRAFATASLPLPELHSLAQAHGATINDLVLLLCSTALRRWFQKRRSLPRASLVAAVPVSLREDVGKAGAAARRKPSAAAAAPDGGHQAGMSLVSLGTHLADPAARLAHVQAAARAMNQTAGGLRPVMPDDFPSLGVPWLLEAASTLYGRARLADRIPQLANLIISNVPGPDQPLYLAGARMLSHHPAPIVVHGLALNITVQSYADQLDFGFMADGAALPEVEELADALRVAFEDLQVLPRPGEADHPQTSLPDRLARRASAAVVGAVVSGMEQLAGTAARAAVDQALRQAFSTDVSKRRTAAGATRRRVPSSKP
jgi:diacylglycerol O-acyltransferase